MTAELIRNTSLRPYNTFRMDVPAETLLVLRSREELPLLTAEAQRPLHILGGGSNVLLRRPVGGTVVLNRLSGIEDIREDDDYIWIRSGAGENWHELVLHAGRRDLGGIENLALIPGTVGASPIQNIGAYGAEVKDTITEVEFWDLEEGAFRAFSNEACRFGYRDSVFKTDLKGRVIVTSVTFRLSKKPALNISYGAVGSELEKRAIISPSVKDIADAVTAIRQSKLPDPAVVGNAGSFFKNPTVSAALADRILVSHPQMPHFPAPAGEVKIPAGWLIESCGWKGHRRGDAGVHPLQALCLVNYGAATGEDIWALSDDILQSVRERFGISLEREVQVW